MPRLAKKTSGRDARNVGGDPDDPFNGGDWTGGSDFDSFGVVADPNYLGWSMGSTDNAGGTYDPLAGKTKGMIQARVQSGALGFAGPAGLLDQTTKREAGVIFITEVVGSGGGGGDRLIHKDDEAGNHLGGSPYTQPAKAKDTYHRVALFYDLAGDVTQGYDEDSDINTGDQSIPGSHNIETQVPGIWAQKNDGRCNLWNHHADRILTVEDVPTGGKAQILDAGDVVLREAGESGGIATINLLSPSMVWMEDAVKVRVVNNLDATVYTIEPSEGVWGGDVYEEIPNDPPATPTISVDSRTDTAVNLDGTAYSDLQDDPHQFSQWQVDAVGGDFSTPVFDSGDDSTNLESINVTGLTADTSYKARVRYKDSNPEGDLWSEWSDPLPFDTLRTGYAQVGFDGVGETSWTNPNGAAVDVELAQQAPGGGGGSSGSEGAGGGGGAGGLNEETVTVAAGETIPITNGAPGGPDEPGQDSLFWCDKVTGLALDPDVDDPADAVRAFGGGEGGEGTSPGELGGAGGSGGGAGCQAEATSGVSGGITEDASQGNEGGDKASIGGSTSCQRGAAGGGGSLKDPGGDGRLPTGDRPIGGLGGRDTWLPKWNRRSGGGGDGGARQFDGKFNDGVCDSRGGEIVDPGGSGSGPGAGGGGAAGKDDDGKPGAAGYTVLQFQRTANLQPDTPTISCEGARETELDFSGSDFSDPDGDGHLASQWQLDVPEGDFSAPLQDTGEVTDDLTAHTFEGLTSERTYKARVRYRDDSGFGSDEWSEWSDPVTCTTTGGSPCGDGSGHEDAATGDRQRMFLGEAGGGGLFLHAKVHEDVDGGTVVGEARTVPIAPAGVRGECHFARIVIVAETWTRGELTFTPIVDGEEITAEKQTLSFTGDGTEKHLHRWEIALSRTDSGGGFRYGMRGTWFQALLELKDLDGCGRVTITGVELDYDVVQERLSAPSFTGPTLELPSRQLRRRWFFGEDGGGGLLEGDEGNDDDGTSVEALAETNVVAPAGFSGECVFRAAYFTVRRANESALTLRFTPIVDDTELETVDVTLEALSGETVLEPRQVDFEQTYAGGSSTYLPRGASFRLRVETVGGLPSDRVELDGFELEYEVVSESLEASNA